MPAEGEEPLAGEPLPPGATIGILGGGQLGRMLALAAARLGFRCHIYCPDPKSPAFDVSAEKTVAAYTDAAALDNFGRAVDIVTYEFENVEVAAAERLAKVVPVRPGAKPLAISQDRLTEKTFLRDIRCEVAPFAAIDGLPSLETALASIGVPSVLKTRRLGYDGKGQAIVRSAEDADAALASLNGAPAILERFVDFEREVSIVAVRSISGDVACYDLAENVHRNGILHTSTVPAASNKEIAAKAQRIAERVLSALDYVGVIGIEFFQVSDAAGGLLLVNEFAPRVHNSGHWTEDACTVSQFENHIRAIAGWPLGSTVRHSDVVMTNLIGSDVASWQSLAAEPGARLHLYGKREARKGRKMGHVNRLSAKGATLA
jgi:5-(carboxyamino)imidazole ribonucleotide synthase